MNDASDGATTDGAEVASAAPPRSAPVRWLRRLLALAVLPALVGLALAAFAAWRAAPPSLAVLIVVVCAVPSLAALWVRARVVWLTEAIPMLLHELRSAPAQQVAAATERSFDERVTEAQHVLERTRRPTIGSAWRTIRLLRDPVLQLRKVATKQLRGQVLAPLTVTTGAAKRLAGLKPLLAVAVAGTVLVYLAAIALLIAGSL